MELGIIGLGRMGMAMGERLVQGGHSVLGFDLSADKSKEAEEKGLKWHSTIAEMVGALSKPKIIWIMVPAGEAVDEAIGKAMPGLMHGDIVIDGGNSYYKDSSRRADFLDDLGIHYLDCGTSGGVWGLEEGFCLMVGGEKAAFSQVEPILKTLAPENGYLWVGPSGAGHYVKMVHNGIEYGMLQAYGEGFEILKSSDYELDLASIAALWNHGSVVRSWLLKMAENAFAASPDLSDIAGYVEDSGEGRWTVFESIDKDVPAPVIALSLMMRFRSRQDESFSAKVIAALRHQFGGHRVKTEQGEG